jgi:tetratricopeptide (TPR) repeat protein
MTPVPAAVVKPVVRAACVGLGSVLAGPLGALTGAFVGGALGDIFGETVASLAAGAAGRFIEKANETFFDKSADSLASRLARTRPTLERVYREAFRLSLREIHLEGRDDYKDWFDNWDIALAADVSPVLEEIQPGHAEPDKFNTLFRAAMERLDAQGSAVTSKSTSIALHPRPAPDALLASIKDQLPEHFEPIFKSLIVSPEQDAAWKEAVLAAKNWEHATLDEIAGAVKRIEGGVDVANQKLDEIRAMLEAQFNAARAQGRIPEQELKARDEEIERLTKLTLELQRQLAARSSEPAEAELSRLLAAGDLDAALRAKSGQVEARRTESAKLPRDLYELGTIHELRFEWSQALVSYREAWELEKNREFGFQYAYLAQKLNHFNEAVPVYEAVLAFCKSEADRATTLNNLAILYRGTQRMKQAEEAFAEALDIRRKLARANPDAYLPYVANTLNNLANLFSGTQRMKQAEEAYAEALETYRQLARTNPDAYLPDVATTLNNLAVLYRATQHMKQAEEAYA